MLYPTLNALTAERCAPSARGRTLAVLNGAFNAGGALGATAWGFVAERHGYLSIFVLASAVSAVSFFVLMSDLANARPR